VRIGIATNYNGIGLETDGRLLERFLLSEGHETFRVQYNQPHEEKYDLVIWLEVFSQHLVPVANRHWIVVNPEWMKPEAVRPVQRNCEKVLAKTRDAERRLRVLFSNVEYTGFFAEDHYDRNVERVDRVLHLGGNSGMRGTNELLACYREYRYYDKSSLPPLTCITNSKMVDTTPVEGVEFRSRVSDEELLLLQNSHRFHAIPSSYEGFGQALHESQGVGAVLLTTGAGPMSELSAPFEANARSGKTYNLGELYEVDICDLRRKLPEMVKQPNYEVARMGVEARARFVRGNRDAGEAFKRLLEPQERRSVAGAGQGREKARIAVWGNLAAQFSTENDWVEAFRSLGHQVITFQENEDSTEDILKECQRSKVNLVAYVHTHSWTSPGAISVDELIVKLREAGVKTVSPHLDLYFGLSQLDGREDKVGIHPFFRTDFVMTADGSSQEKFEAKGVRHVWLPPGVSAVWCKAGDYQKDLAVDVAFVGAEGYHPEWKWRGEMLTTLRAAYGERFRVFQGYRGQSLNDLMASVKVFVGDCCFAGKPKYWSDRLPEHAGRGGFILYPQIQGMCIPTATFTPCDIQDLLARIDYYLENEEERELIRRTAHQHVKRHDTYAHRAQQILRTVGL
jgi:glycosyltransferase involved in cell wall biosynthesis